MVGERIRQARQQAGFSQKHLADIAHLQQCQISDLEHDSVKLDRVEWGTIRRLCDALHLTPNELMGYQDSKKR